MRSPHRTKSTAGEPRTRAECPAASTPDVFFFFFLSVAANSTLFKIDR